MPSSQAQEAAIRASYANAGIPGEESCLTGYVECHGTGTLAGDPVEIAGLAAAFGPSSSADGPLVIAAGLSGLIRAVLAIKNKLIPGTATFITPNPAIDFQAAKVRASRRSVGWPSSSRRRASVDSFGFGGANAHVVVEAPEYLLHDAGPFHKSSFLDADDLDEGFFDVSRPSSEGSGKSSRPTLLVASANDEKSLKSSIQALASHVLNPIVQMSLQDLAYTLSERRSRLHHRAFSITHELGELSPSTFVAGQRPKSDSVQLGFVFTGQGSQWPGMGRDLIRHSVVARQTVEALDASLATLSEPPNFSLVAELVEERPPGLLRDPAFSQPLTTALQLAYLAVLTDWGITPVAVAGHASGEIAAAVAAGYLGTEEAIKIAFLRGQAIKRRLSQESLGMLAVGISKEGLQDYLTGTDLDVACYNSPESLTLSGPVESLKNLQQRLQADSHFARLLQVDTAYHSRYIESAGALYRQLLLRECNMEGRREQKGAIMYSTITGQRLDAAVDQEYWVQNLACPVRFDGAVLRMVSPENGSGANVNLVVEIGPSNTLAGPVSQIFKSASHHASYVSVAKRGPDALRSLYHVAGTVFAAGGSVDIARVNEYDKPCTLIDLPGYTWNHSTKYWREGLASRDWRYRPFVRHDLLGSKILGSSWAAPVWHNRLSVSALPWLRDHRIGDQLVFPGSGYVAMAMEAMYQSATMVEWTAKKPDNFQYRFRDVRCIRALVLQEDDDSDSPVIMLSLSRSSGLVGSWYEFRISPNKGDEGDTWHDHAAGLVWVESVHTNQRAPNDFISPLTRPVPASTWYKSMSAAGFNYGPAFQNHVAIESTQGQRVARSLVSMEPLSSATKGSTYTIHPACMNGCFQTVVVPIRASDRSNKPSALMPVGIDSLIVPARARQPEKAISSIRAN